MDEIVYIGLLEDDALELDVSALQIAEMDHPGAPLEQYIELLGAIGERLLDVAKGARTAEDRAAALRQVFAAEFGFAGDRDSYDDPANADLIRVIDRRRGLPISLAILYVAAARRIEWHAEVLNTPGHVLIRIGAAPDGLILDPFDRGVVVQADHPALRVAETSRGNPRPTAMSNRAALVRLMTNQASRADNAGDQARALTVYSRMTVVAPSHAHGWWERARLELALGQPDAAKASLSAMLEVTRDPILRRHITATLGTLSAMRR